ncbi:MAG: hypothetical protein WBA74_14520 [Cyclobacteriaceae bacterium]
MSDRDTGHWGQYLFGSSVIRIFGSITDTIFRRGDRKKGSEENLKLQKELKKLEHQYRSQEQEKAHQRAREQHLEGMRLKAALDEETQKRQQFHQRGMATQDYEYKQRLAVQNHANQLEAIGYKASLDRQGQAQSHANQLEAIGYKASLDRQGQERGFLFQQQQLILSNELQFIRELLLRQSAHEDVKKLEEFRLGIAALDRYIKRTEENSPFIDLPETLREAYYREIYSRGEKQPLILISSFYQDTLTNEANDKGGFLDFNEAIDDALESSLSQAVIKRNGYFKRPLRHKDRDLDILVSAFSDIPTILIRGKVKGKQQIQPIITIWNLPGCLENSHLNFVLRSFDFPPANTDRGLLKIQSAVAAEVATIVGMLSDAYHLVVNGKRPNLNRYAFDNPEQLKILASELGFYYDLICEAEPEKETFYRLEQTMMLGECQLQKEAVVQAEKTFISWYLQTTGKKEISQIDLSNISLESNLLTPTDRQFLAKLADVYQSIGVEEKAVEVLHLIEETKHSYQPIERFQRDTKSKLIKRFQR